MSAVPVNAQLLPGQAQPILNAIGARVEAVTILGGDFGFSDGTFTVHSRSALEPGQSADLDMRVVKIGGSGDVGDPGPVDDLDVGWQPRLQGNIGYLDSSHHLTTAPLAGDTSEFRTYAIEFGGGARFWTSEKLSFAPTLMVLYGHTTESYFATSTYARQNLPQLKKLGIIDWSVDSWSVRPALNAQYIVAADRALITFSSDFAWFSTHGFAGSNVHVRVEGNSSLLTNKIDLDVPLGVELFGHELRSGGYLSRTELFGDLKTGLAVQHLNEIHGRVVLDFLNQLWKVQWLGLGASYLWGPNVTGWTVDADAAFHF